MSFFEQLVSIKPPILSEEMKKEVNEAVEILHKKVDEAALGNQSLARVRANDSLVPAPTKAGLEGEDVQNYRIRVRTNNRVLQLRLNTFANMRVLLVNPKDDEAIKAAIEALEDKLYDPFDPAATMPSLALEDRNKILTLDNIAEFNIGNMQDFQGLLQAGSYVTECHFICGGYIFSWVDDETAGPNKGHFALSSNGYSGGPKFISAIRKLDWAKDDALNKFIDERNKMYGSAIKPAMNIPRTLARIPFFVPRVMV